MTMPWPDATFLLAPLAHWFDQARRELPWRAQDLRVPHPDPYAVLVSEAMLQQTQVATVLPYYRAWMTRWPTVQALAEASDAEVHKAWEGLGYYRRARHLHAAARRVAQEGWPKDRVGLAQLPGLGPYASAAVAAQAFQLPEPALDGNALRVLARLLALEDPRRAVRRLEAWLRPALATLGPSRLTQALMEAGALHCTPQPRCTICPLSTSCDALRQGQPEAYPLPRPRPKPKEVDLWLWALEVEGHWLVVEPRAKGLLAGLWTWPTQADPGPTHTFALPVEQAWGPPGWTQVYTHRRETIIPCIVRLDRRPSVPAGHTWISQRDLPHLAMGSRDQRLRRWLEARGPAMASHMVGTRLAALLGALVQPPS